MAGAHYMSMVAIGLGSLLFGMLPVCFSLRANRSYPLFLSLILCFGAGVLIATSLVHMLTEVQEKLKLYSQIYFCVGFLLLFTFDEITHYCCGNRKQETHKHQPENNTALEYGAVRDDGQPSETSGLLHSRKIGLDVPEGRGKNLDESSHSSHLHQSMRCHVDIGEPCSSSPSAKTGLLVALLIHSILEGISIGVQTETNQIYLLLGAVSFHKIVLSFCFGLELLADGFKGLSIFLAIFLFSIGSPIGILIGMSVTSTNGIFAVDAQLQAIAAGSLLYVAAFEVLPRERFKWQHKSSQKAAGIFQLVFLLLGFSAITTLCVSEMFSQ